MYDMHKLSQLLLSGVFIAGGQLGLTATTTATTTTMATSNAAHAHESNGVAVSETQLQPVWLARTGECPTTPKPQQDSDQCQGRWASGCTCRNESPFGEDGRDVILAGCPCCLDPYELSCDLSYCQAPTGSRVCQAEQQRGCVCMTTEERHKLFEDALGRAMEDPDYEPAYGHTSINPSDIADFGGVQIRTPNGSHPASPVSGDSTTIYSFTWDTIETPPVLGICGGPTYYQLAAGLSTNL
ncbi:hypothetical protein F4680DRAFT_130490 [Xylaria scruposa]|nr:hypothetical protein F4680DRAFT_130490 [Xylaria scruposa]